MRDKGNVHRLPGHQRQLLDHFRHMAVSVDPVGVDALGNLRIMAVNLERASGARDTRFSVDDQIGLYQLGPPTPGPPPGSPRWGSSGVADQSRRTDLGPVQFRQARRPPPAAGRGRGWAAP